MFNAIIKSNVRLSFALKSIHPAKGINTFFFSMIRKITSAAILAWRCVIASPDEPPIIFKTSRVQDGASAQKYELWDRFIEPIPLESVRHRTARRYQRQLPATCAHGAPSLPRPLLRSLRRANFFFVPAHPAARMAIFNVLSHSSS